MNEAKKLASGVVICVIATFLIGGSLAGATSSETDRDIKSDVDKALRGYAMRLQQPAQSRRGRMPNYVMSSFDQLLQHAKELKLSDEQVKEIKGYAAQYAQVVIQAEAELERAEEDIVGWQHDDNADMSTAELAMKQSDAALAAVWLRGKKALHMAAAVLTPEQREKWQDLRVPVYMYHLALRLSDRDISVLYLH